jgi:hypothetical protein
MTTTWIWIIGIGLWLMLAFVAGVAIGKGLRRADSRRPRPSRLHADEIFELDENDEPKPPMSPPGVFPPVTWHEFWWDAPDDDDPSAMN